MVASFAHEVAGHTITPDHVKEKEKADRPEKDKAKHHGHDPCGSAARVQPIAA
jgi:hypothetical protein